MDLETSENMLAFHCTPFKSRVKHIPQVKNAGIKTKRMHAGFGIKKDSFGIQYLYSHKKELQLLPLWYCHYVPHLLPS